MTNALRPPLAVSLVQERLFLKGALNKAKKP